MKFIILCKMSKDDLCSYQVWLKDIFMILIFSLFEAYFSSSIFFTFMALIPFYILLKYLPVFGQGDVLIFMALSCSITALSLLKLINYSFIFAGIYALYCLIRKKKDKSSRLAFVPFITVAYFYLEIILPMCFSSIT